MAGTADADQTASLIQSLSTILSLQLLYLFGYMTGFFIL